MFLFFVFVFLEMEFQNGAHFKLFLDSIFQIFLVTRKKTQNIQQGISHLHIHRPTSYFAHPIDFFPYEQILQKYEFILFGSPWRDSGCFDF